MLITIIILYIMGSIVALCFIAEIDSWESLSRSCLVMSLFWPILLIVISILFIVTSLYAQICNASEIGIRRIFKAFFNVLIFNDIRGSKKSIELMREQKRKEWEKKPYSDDELEDATYPKELLRKIVDEYEEEY